MNHTVRQFFENYHLLREHSFEVFAREQTKLFSPELVTVTSDYRGTQSYHGSDGFFQGLASWSKYFFVNGKSRHEFIEERADHVFVRMHGDIGLLMPMGDQRSSKVGQHAWTEEFYLSNDLIIKIDIELMLHLAA
jgi:hypothetical protein